MRREDRAGVAILPRAINRGHVRSTSATTRGSGSFGIGLILFNAKDPQQPAFEIRVRAAKYEPAMFYVNRCMQLIEDQSSADGY